MHGVSWKVFWFIPLVAIVWDASVVRAHNVRGVAPEDQHLYQGLAHNQTQWTCLNDSSIVLSVNQINDDYCDCPDGSDEPGTGACGSRSRFFCRNEGFIPRYIAGYKVEDGLCDCCDCSDEVSPEPHLRGATCSELAREYDSLLAQELATYEQGRDALVQMRQHYGVDSITSESTAERANKLAEELSAVVREIEQQKDTLANVLKLYESKLAQDNPTASKFNKLDIKYVTDAVGEVFANSERLARAHKELRHILDTLVTTYNPKLRDNFVNRNMEKYIDYSDTETGRNRYEPRLVTMQGSQLREYFGSELEELFLDGKATATPIKDVIPKFHVARGMVLTKISDKDNILAAVAHLRGIMDEISAKYNVNFQDSGVIAAVRDYRRYQERYPTQSLDYEIPARLVEELDTIGRFVVTETENLEKPDSLGGLWGHLSNIRDYIAPSSSYSGLKTQIASLEQTLKNLGQKRDSLERQWKSAKQEMESQHTYTHEELLLKDTEQLLQKLDDFCISSKFDEYTYHICFNPDTGRILQVQDRDRSVVLVGHFKDFKLVSQRARDAYINQLQTRATDVDLIGHLSNYSPGAGHDLLLGNLPDIHNGLLLSYGNGHKCWNGPYRSAEVFVLCGPEYKLTAVHEPSTCQYLFELSGPLGCALDFAYSKPT
ncbi:AGR178Wp [Eremothecium gossypii ATCC 10895]|uniref:Glucosidase 2 subunit beta n=1 Tax=Eremothecium gossypii (strain ATCC 10895 / CBS 109.51 / FGSC 9923 / NRRL Y-1056) TaxID=284811 RepID=Q74ZM0_EREGS|nr:AGR178Wp [Eremothecium gossypii ATCC 10895]AAS54668.2 AGR178Wp [Eremothecium gossypii ATCC 10895]